MFRARAQAMLETVRGDPGRATALSATMLQPSEWRLYQWDRLEARRAYQWDRLEARRAAGVAALLARQHTAAP